MVRLELSDEDAGELSEALTAQLHRLRSELNAADARQYKHELRERLDRLERVATQLAGATAESGEQPVAG